ncbi:MAG: HPP family protein [Burkholderiaceae bacterium]
MKIPLRWLRPLFPEPIRVNRAERLRAVVGALIGILATGIATPLLFPLSPDTPWLVAPMGASAVLLFALPSSPLAKPWSLMGGNLVSALIGVTCALWIADKTTAAAVACALAIGAMLWLRCLHPPSGAIALTAVLGGPAITKMGYHFLLLPVAGNSLLLVASAMLFNTATRRHAHGASQSHQELHHTNDAAPVERLGFSHDDLDAVIKRYNEVLDISRDDLESLFHQAEMHAYRRRFGDILCADIMSRDVVTVEYGTSLEEAWTRLRSHRIKAMPVVDAARRVIGIVTQADFMRHAELDLHTGFDAKLRQFIRRHTDLHSDKPEIVGQIMTRRVHLVRADTHIVNLVPLVSERGLHHVPVIDGERRLAGMITQSDLVAALYQGSFGNQGQALAA